MEAAGGGGGGVGPNARHVDRHTRGPLMNYLLDLYASYQSDTADRSLLRDDFVDTPGLNLDLHLDHVKATSSFVSHWYHHMNTVYVVYCLRLILEAVLMQCIVGFILDRIFIPTY